MLPHSGNRSKAASHLEPKGESGQEHDAKKSDDAFTPKARGPAARPSMGKADCLNPSHGGNMAVLWERGHRPHPMGRMEELRQSYRLHRSQLSGREKRRKGSLTTQRRERVTWGSPTSGEGQGDGGIIVVRRFGAHEIALEEQEGEGKMTS
jgi:hypothetical protein